MSLVCWIVCFSGIFSEIFCGRKFIRFTYGTFLACGCVTVISLVFGVAHPYCGRFFGSSCSGLVDCSFCEFFEKRWRAILLSRPAPGTFMPSVRVVCCLFRGSSPLTIWFINVDVCIGGSKRDNMHLVCERRDVREGIIG